jgi:hypothetical protein
VSLERLIAESEAGVVTDELIRSCIVVRSADHLLQLHARPQFAAALC